MTVAMHSPTVSELRLCAVVHIEAEEVTPMSVKAGRCGGGERRINVVTSIDEASGYVGTCHKKTRRKTAELLNQHVPQIERQGDCSVIEIVLDDGRSYAWGTKYLKAERIKVCATTRYTHEKIVRTERMNRTAEIAFQNGLFFFVLPANLWVERLYAVCAVKSLVVWAGCPKSTEAWSRFETDSCVYAKF